MAKQPLDDDQRQQFVDNLPDEQVNPNAAQIFDSAIERAAKPRQSKPETPELPDGYSDIQTHSDKVEDTSD